MTLNMLQARLFRCSLDTRSYTPEWTPPQKTSDKKDAKDASVIGRAVVGGIVAGPAGAVVGALSAVDKNNKNNQNK